MGPKMPVIGVSVVMLVALCLALRGACAKYSVLGLSASPVDNDPYSIRLTWEYPTQGPLVEKHGAPKYFSISYSLANAYGCRAVPNATDYNNRRLVRMLRRGEHGDYGEFTLEGLEPNSVYFLYVQAHTSSRTFPESNAVGVTNQKIPDNAPTGVRLVRNESSATSLKFVWDKAPCTAGSRSSEFLGFRYNLTLGESPVRDPHESVSAEVLVTDLKPYAKYGFRVQIASEEGYGPYSRPFYAVTMGEEVSLTQLSEVAVGETAEFVCRCRGGSDYSVPSPDSVVLKGPEGQVQKSSSAVSGSTMTNHFRVVVDGPDAKFTCTLHYEGFDDVLGTASLTVAFYEKPYLLTPPTAFMDDPSPGNVTVTWLPWTDNSGGDGPVDYEEVVWRHVGDLEYDIMAVRPGSRSVVIGDLEPDGEYEFAVVLFRKGVPGPPNKAIVTEAVTASTEAADGEIGFRNLHGPEEDNKLVAAVSMGLIALLIVVSAIGVWCTGRKHGRPSEEDQQTLTQKPDP